MPSGPFREYSVAGSATFTPEYAGVHQRTIALDRSGPASITSLHSVAAGTGNRVEIGTVSNVGALPEGIAGDPGNGHVLVADAGSPVTFVPYGDLVVLNGSTHRISATVGLNAGPSSPQAVAYDAANGEVFVTDQGTGNIEILNGSTNKPIGTVDIPCGANSSFYNSYPGGIAYDPWSGYLYATEYCLSAGNDSSSLIVVNGTSGQLVRSIPVGADPIGVAVDTRNHTIFVTNYVSENVSVVDASSGRIVKWLWLGKNPTGIAYDSADDRIYVANSGWDNITAVNATSYKVTAWIPTGNGPTSIAIDSSNGTFDVANYNSNNVTLVNTTTERSVGSFATGKGPIAIFFDSQTNQTYVSNSGSGSLTIMAPLIQTLSIGGLSGPSVADVGVPLSWTINASGGVGPLHYAWQFGDQGSKNATGPSIQYTYGYPGRFNLDVEVFDSLGFNVTQRLSVEVNPLPFLSTPLASAPSADAGQMVSFETWANGGTPPFVGYSWSGLGSSCNGSGTPLITCRFTTPGVYRISATVIDSAGGTSIPSTALDFQVYGRPGIGAPISSRPSVDLGQPVSFAASPVNGSSGFSFNWSGLPEGCGGAGPIVSCIPTKPGTYEISTQVEDSNGIASNASGELTFPIYPDPSAHLTASRTAIDIGQSFEFEAVAANGSGNYQYHWDGLPTGCSGGNRTLYCRPSAAGLYEVTAIANDSNGALATSNAVVVVVGETLGVAIVLTTGETYPGSNLTFEALVSGGLSPTELSWQFGDGTNGTGDPVSHSFRSAGQFMVTVRATDATGALVSQVELITVSVRAPQGIPSGTSISVQETLFGASIAFLAVAVVLLVWSRRGKTGGAGPSSVAPPSVGPGTDERTARGIP